MSNGVRFSEAAPRPIQQIRTAQQLPADHKPTGFWDAVVTMGTVVDRLAFSGWILFWLAVAGWSAWIAYETNEPRVLWLTATASANVFSYKLTGTSWRELKKRLAKLPYVICGVVAAGGVWLSLHFNDPDVLKVTMIVVLFGLMVSYAIS